MTTELAAIMAQRTDAQLLKASLEGLLVVQKRAEQKAFARDYIENPSTDESIHARQLNSLCSAIATAVDKTVEAYTLAKALQVVA